MLRNLLTTAWRSLWRDRSYAALNILGLALGLATCLVIGLYVAHELSYDRFHPDAERTYRLLRADAAWDSTQVATASFWTPAGAWASLDLRAPGPPGNAQTPPGLAGAIEAQFPEVEAITYLSRSDNMLVGRGDERAYVDDVVRTDAQFFSVFGGFELLHGRRDAALVGPGKAVLTASMAERLFGTEQPVGETFTLENRATYTVTGVVADPPSTSHVPFTMLLSLTDGQRALRTGSIRWYFFGQYRYVKLRPGADPAAFQRKLQAFAAANGKPARLENHLVLQALPSIHLFSAQLSDDIAPQGDVRYLTFFALVALLVLGIAGVNYTNLATAQALRRAREVGVRKTMGARRGQLAGQFLGEATLAATAALPLAVGGAALALPFVNQWTGLALSVGMLREPAVGAGLLAAVVVVGLCAGAYPAVLLSRSNPSRVLRGQGGGDPGAAWVRQGLVVFQFAASVALIIGTFAVQAQLDYVQQKRLGFDEERVVTFQSNDLGEQYATFKAAATQRAGIQHVSSGPPPGLGRLNRTVLQTDEATGERRPIHIMNVDHDYLETAGLELVAGRTFDRSRATDPEEAVVLTEAAVQALDVGESPVGQTLRLREEPQTVIGVVRDFHNQSLHAPIEPVVLDLEPGNNYTALVRLAPGRTDAGLDAVRAAWGEVLPDRPFTFSFLDQRIEAQYRAEQRLATLFAVFAGLAVCVAGLGLFGLVAYAARRRTREIGIRKVLGASVTAIVGLLSKDFLRLVGVAFVLAAPLAYLGVHAWMEQFSYRASVGSGLFLGAGACIAAAALLVVGAQAARAALTDPVSAIRQE